MTKNNNYLAFDIGGTHVKWGILDEEGTIITKDHFSSDGADGDTILNGLREKITEWQSSIKGIAISSPGFIDPDKGYLEKGGAILAFDDFYLQKNIEKDFDLPVSIENDVNCVALAEQWLGKGKNLTDFVCITVGTGIGGALILNNQLYRGHSFRGGEFGFMITQGMQTTIPVQASLSSSASVLGLRKKYANYFDLPLKEVSGELVFQAYDSKEPVATQMVETFYQSLAIGIYNITSVLNPEKILIGGAITTRQTFIKELEQHLNYIDQVFRIGIDTCQFKNDAGLVGALALHLSKYQRVVTRVCSKR